MCGSVSLQVCIDWVPSESSGLHAGTIKGKMDEKAETSDSERVVEEGGGERVHMCITLMANVHNEQDGTTFT